MRGFMPSPACCATKPSASTTTSRTCSTPPRFRASRCGRNCSGSSRSTSSMPRSSTGSAGSPAIRLRSTSIRICRSCAPIRRRSAKRWCRSSTMPRNIPTKARRSGSPRGPTVTPSCCRSTTAAPGSPAKRNAWSADASSADRATPRPRRAQALGFGSRMPLSRRTAARSKSRATASTAAPLFRFICRHRARRRQWRLPLMTEIPSSVLVIDDEVQIRRFLRTGFELDGFTVQEAETGAEALRSATLKPSDLVILDLNLPDMDGADVLERLRACSTVPLIVLSVRANEAEKVRLLELGADDYVVKPFGMAELLARAHSAMRRQLRAARSEPVVKFGPLSIDFAARAVFISDQRVTLTPKEYRLLQILAQHSGNVVTHQSLLREVWGNEHIDDTHYLRIFVRKLRRKIEADPTQPTILLTELGVGYRLVMSDPPAAATQQGGQGRQPASQGPQETPDISSGFSAA